MQCPICLNAFEQLDKHHIYPKAFGGPDDGELFDLCSGCHQAVHSQAKAFASKAKVKKYYLSSDAIKRAEFLIYAIMQAERNYKAGRTPAGSGDGRIHEVSFKLDRHKLQLLHSAKKILGFTSVQSMMDKLVDELIAKAHGVLPENISGHYRDPRVLTPGSRPQSARVQAPPPEQPKRITSPNVIVLTATGQIGRKAVKPR